MATYEFYIYANTALAYNPDTDSFDLDPDYTPWNGRYRIVVEDDDSTFDTTGDGNQTATVYDMDGNVVTSGLITVPEYYVAGEVDPMDLVYLDWIEVDGVHVGYASDQVLTPGESYQYLGGDTYSMEYAYFEDVSLPCFAPETLIETASGQVRVSDIRRGDMVLTLEHGLQPVLWTGAQRVRGDDPAHWPVTLSQALPGTGTPIMPLRLSAQHRVLLCDPWFDLLGIGPEVFAPASGLTSPRKPTRAVIWHHLLFARHEIIQAAGLWVESLFAGGRTFRDLPPIHRISAQQALAHRDGHRQTARPCLRHWEAELFMHDTTRTPEAAPARVA
jgi:hypothetical protein